MNSLGFLNISSTNCFEFINEFIRIHQQIHLNSLKFINECIWIHQQIQLNLSTDSFKIFTNYKLASNTIQVHRDPKYLLSLKQVHQVASRYIKLQAGTSRCIKVHRAATKYIKMHLGTSGCIEGHLEHPAASRVILSIHKNVLVQWGTTCTSIDIQDIQVHRRSSWASI